MGLCLQQLKGIIYDIFRLTELLEFDTKIDISETISVDVKNFIQGMKEEEINLKQLGIRDKNKEEVLMQILKLYGI